MAQPLPPVVDRSARSPRSDAVADAEIAAQTQRIAAGDEAAFREFYQRYAGRIMAYALVLHAGDEARARDTWQTTLVKAAAHMQPFASEGRLWGWLATIARRAAFDSHRASSRFGRLRERLAAWWRPEVVATTGVDDAAGMLRRALERLGDTDRALIEEKYFENRPVREIATDRHCSEKAVESALTRARQRLRIAFLEELRHE